MIKEHIIIRVSKVYTSGYWSLSIQANLNKRVYSVDLPTFGKFPKVNSKEFETLNQKLKIALQSVFQEVSFASTVPGEASVRYKCIFSDKYIVNGDIATGLKKVETIKEMTLPMSEQECLIVYDNIPRGL